jgi:hypothetical protein
MIGTGTKIFQEHDLKIHRLAPDDINFTIQGKFTIARRATIEITKSCPAGYREIIAECYNRGWIEPVAYITDQELIFIGLSK